MDSISVHDGPCKYTIDPMFYFQKRKTPIAVGVNDSLATLIQNLQLCSLFYSLYVINFLFHKADKHNC